MRAAASLPRIRRFFSERPRPIAAILTGFSHNTGNLAQSRENPFPSPRAAPAPRGISPALLRRRVAVSPPRAPGRCCADPRSQWSSGFALPASGAGGCMRPALQEHVCGKGAFPTRGIPLMRVYGVENASPPAAAETVVKTEASWEEAG